MKTLIFTAVLILILPLHANTIYDPYGRYKGILDNKGLFFELIYTFATFHL